MTLDFTQLRPGQIYRHMIGVIQPRPIAWVSTVSADGVVNLAPFSFFQGVTCAPPTLLVTVVNSHKGELKDTVRNLRTVPEFVVNSVSFPQVSAMNATSAPFPPDISEPAACGIAMTASTRVKPPRVTASKASFECTVRQILEIGEGPLAAHLIIGDIHLLHVDETVLDAEGLIDPVKYDLVGRLGRDDYARMTDLFQLGRPE
jgi:flavin reductase (DIM6/NTAB) family NADH-FMN oxidoreductase RutF